MRLSELPLHILPDFDSADLVPSFSISLSTYNYLISHPFFHSGPGRTSLDRLVIPLWTMLRPVVFRLSTRKKLSPQLISSLSSSCTAPASSRIPHNITRQRRDSSSKPSSSAPPNGSDSNPVSATPDTSSRKKGSFSKANSRLKAKETVPASNNLHIVASSEKKEETFAIPSVPSTQHLHLQGLLSRCPPIWIQTDIRNKDIHLASLFAFHRPISVHHAIPQTVSNKRFGQIFVSKPSQPKPYGDVISTISSTVSNILKDIEKNPENKNVSRVVVSDSVANANMFDKGDKTPNYVTQQGTPVYIDIDAMVRNLPPYVAPPPPKKHVSRKSRARVSKIAKMEEFFTSSSIEMVEVFEPEDITSFPRAPLQPFLERMHVRRMEYLERNREILQAISVRRQRKLKMKKHKYKKLMKRTRNLRKRQDRL